MDMMFTVAFFVGMFLEALLRMPYDRAHRNLQKTSRRAPLSEQVVLAALMLGGLLLPLVFAFTPWLDEWNYPWSAGGKAALGWSGIVFLAGGLWLFWRAHHDLSGNWSPTLEIGADQSLVTVGVYRFMRHPMYAAQLLLGIAQALLLHNWLAGWGGLAAFLVLYLLRIPREERMMADHFGDAYRVYAQRTGSIFPRLPRASDHSRSSK
jgi:protein-S-isoprenylcysteine O-methyltransferase Ste14